MKQENDAYTRALKQLDVLTATTRALARGVYRSPSDILEMVYKQVSKLMHTDNMYVALYDKVRNTIRFELAFVDGRRVDVKGGDSWQPCELDREWIERIIRTQSPILHATKEEAETWCTQFGHEEYARAFSASWLGAPMVIKDRTLGVIAVYHPTESHVYDKDDLKILQTIACQAAIALDNTALLEEKEQVLRLLREEQAKSIAAGRLAAVNAVAAGFVHRMNNVAGTMPVRVMQIKELLSPDDFNYSKIVHYLDAINEDADNILRMALTIRLPGTDESLELVDVDILISTAIQRIAVPPGITVDTKCNKDLPPILAFSGQFVDVLENLIRNGVEAIDDSGAVTVEGRTLMTDSQEWVAIEVKDTGRGIPSENLHRIFDLFFSTKPDGMGFALWRAKTFVESLGGRIDVSSAVGNGTTFTILLPVQQKEPSG